MDTLIIHGTSDHPSVIMNPETGEFKIKGKSVPHDGREFYEPVLAWLDDYTSSPCNHTHITFDLEYFNISSSKMLLFILYKLNELQLNGYGVSVSWRYQDEEDEMYEVGEDYAFMVDIPFEFIPSNPTSQKAS